MKKETPFLDFYYKCMRSGSMPAVGLCWSLRKQLDFITLFDPCWTPPNDFHLGYVWGYNGTEIEFDPYNSETCFAFTTLRQNIVLLCAAINGEL